MSSRRFPSRGSSISMIMAGALTASAIAAPAMAEDRDRIYINPAIGMQLFDDKRDLDESATYQLGLEYRFSDHWAIEAVYGKSDPERKYTDGDVSVRDYRLDGLYYFGAMDDSIQPYLGMGAGHTEFDGNGESRINAGGGLRFVMNDTLSLRLDAREFFSLDEDAWDTLVSLGVSLAFGREAEAAPPPPAPAPPPAPEDTDSDGVPDNRDQCPGTPAGAPVNAQGCLLDSDDDGVADYQDRCPGTARDAEVDENGCEGVTERVETVELTVHFPLNSAEIVDLYDEEIRQVAEFMERYPDTTVEIAGHSDSTGEASYNLDLSQRRAEAVAARLIQHPDIDGERVTARGYGEAEPIADNSTEAGRARNRRVEARIIKVIR